MLAASARLAAPKPGTAPPAVSRSRAERTECAHHASAATTGVPRCPRPWPLRVGAGPGGQGEWFHSTSFDAPTNRRPRIAVCIPVGAAFDKKMPNGLRTAPRGRNSPHMAWFRNPATIRHPMSNDRIAEVRIKQVSNQSPSVSSGFRSDFIAAPWTSMPGVNSSLSNLSAVMRVDFPSQPL